MSFSHTFTGVPGSGAVYPANGWAIYTPRAPYLFPYDSFFRGGGPGGPDENGYAVGVAADGTISVSGPNDINPFDPQNSIYFVQIGGPAGAQLNFQVKPPTIQQINKTVSGRNVNLTAFNVQTFYSGLNRVDWQIFRSGAGSLPVATGSGLTLSLTSLPLGNYSANATAVDNNGLKFTASTSFSIVNIPPVPVITYVIGDEGFVNFDGSASYDPDGTVVAWNWSFYLNSTFLSSSTLVAPSVTFSGPGTVWAFLSVTDNDNASSSTGQIFTLPDDVFYQSLGTVLDPQGNLFTAVKSGNDVQVYQFRSGIASRVTRALISNAKNPSLWRKAGSNLLFLAATDRTGNNAYVWLSKDNGATFTQGNMIFDSTYKNCFVADTVDGGAVAVALKAGTSEIWFRRSPDGLTWPSAAPYAPVLIASLGSSTNKVAHVRQQHLKGSLALIATNGSDWVYKSLQMGRSGSWTAVP